MPKILAPTRGGEASFTNQDRAIAFARETNAELHFLYVSDITVLDQHSSSLLLNLEDDLDALGEFVLAMAQERALKQGVEAGAIVRRGQLREVLDQLVEELGIDCVILGRPEEGTGITTFEALRDLAQDLSDNQGVETVMVAKGEIVYQSNRS